jgi:hypothetical protein
VFYFSPYLRTKQNNLIHTSLLKDTWRNTSILWWQWNIVGVRGATHQRATNRQLSECSAGPRCKSRTIEVWEILLPISFRRGWSWCIQQSLIVHSNTSERLWSICTGRAWSRQLESRWVVSYFIVGVFIHCCKSFLDTQTFLWCNHTSSHRHTWPR